MKRILVLLAGMIAAAFFVAPAFAHGPWVRRDLQGLRLAGGLGDVFVPDQRRDHRDCERG